jgi:DNA-binding NtrC family response regulator
MPWRRARVYRILVVDDEPDICRALRFFLSREGYAVDTAPSGERALALMERAGYDLVLTDLRMDGMDGMDLLDRASRLHPGTIVVMMTAYATVESAVAAMKKGAADYIMKPFVNEDVRRSLHRLLEHRRLLRENENLRHQLSRLAGKDFVGDSPAMQSIFRTLEKVVATKSNILLMGESGTGKGRLAEMVHCSSPRVDHHFMAINCSAIPETLLESELFGYRKGAFTGADRDKPGLIAMADRGTLFLDEIGDMPMALQSKLLKVIETGELMPLGGTAPARVDVRIVAATNKDLDREIAEGRFRSDLYYRLNTIEIIIPPLRERREDIAALAEYFLARFAREHGKGAASFAPEAMEALSEYAWPGNVRELGNTIERAVLLASSNLIGPGDLPPKVRARGDVPHDGGALRDVLAFVERHTIVERMALLGGDKEATARDLGIDLATLYRKMKKLGIG